MSRRYHSRKFGTIKTVIYGRTAMITLGFFTQLALMIVGYIVLRNYSFLFYGLFLAVSAVAVLQIFNANGTPDLKLSWMLPIALFPIFGAIFYATIIMQPGSKVMKGRLTQLSKQTKRYLSYEKEAWEHLLSASPHMGQLARYLFRYDNSPVYENTQVKYYPSGEEMFQDMMMELENAKQYIFMEFFIVCEGRMWDAIHDVLVRKVQQGVEVRFMYDGTDVLFNLPNSYPKLLKAEGIQCKMFAPIRPVFSPHYNNRDHRKVMVVDGKAAFTGGINIADEYINEKERFGHWKDCGVRILGDAADRFTFMFLEMWNESEKTQETYERYVRPLGVSMPSDGYVIPYSVTPLGTERVGKAVYLDMVNTAHTYVHFMTPYLVPDHEMLSALCYAAKRGVEVCIIMPCIPDKKYVFTVAKTYYAQLLKAGVKIYQYTPGFVHAKVLVADDVKAVVGTVNLDYRSLYHHFECGLILYLNSQVVAIEKDVQDTIQKSAFIEEDYYKKLKLREKIIGYILRIVAPLM